MYQQRIQKIQEFLKENNCQGFLVSNFHNINYVTGFHGHSETERESSVFITTDAVHLFLPAMYEQAGLKLATVQNGSVQIHIDLERDGLLTMFTKFLQADKPFFFESEDLRFAEVQDINNKVSVPLLPNTELFTQLRSIKSEEEITLIKKAVEITDQVFAKVVSLLKNTDYTQLTELDIVDQIRLYARELGGDGFGFDPIVAVGAGAAEPHYATGNVRLKPGNALLMDFGITYKGYTGDLTRMVYLGTAPEEYKQHYDAVLNSNEAGIQACRAGVAAGAVYHAANNILKAENLDSYFIHGLGHGVGLQIHEPPTLRAGREKLLQRGEVVTIEPGIYFPGKYGIRIEDYVVVRENMCEVLSTSSKQLIEI